MKKLSTITLAMAISGISFAQNVGINTTGAIPNSSALLDIDAAPLNNKGLLIPRVSLTSTTDATTIATPATSLMVYNTATISDVFPGYYYWNGTIWVRMINTGNSNGTDWSLTGNTGILSTNFIGTTTAADFKIRTNNLERMTVEANGNVGIGTTTPLAKLHLFGGDIYLTDKPINNFNTSRSAFTLKTDNITAASDNGIRIYDGNSFSHIHIGCTTFAYLQSYNTSSISPGTLGTSTMDFDDNANFGTLALNPLGGNVGIGTTFPNSKLNIYNGNIFVNEPTGLLSSLLTGGGLELYRDPTASTGQVNGYVDFKGNATDDEDFRIFYNNTYGTNGGFELGGTTDGQPGTYTTRVVILNSNGNTGIGTVVPSARLSVNGTANKPGGGSWAVFSDKRLKKNITDYNDGLDLLSKVHVVNFQYNNKYFNLFGESKEVRKSTYQGVIAQELQKIAPYMVAEKTVEVKDTTGQTVSTEKVLEVDPSAFTYMLINAVKEQQQIIESLKVELDEIKRLVIKK